MAEISLRRRILLDLLSEPRTVAEIVEATGFGEKTTRLMLRVLKLEGKVITQGGKGHYVRR